MAVHLRVGVEGEDVWGFGQAPRIYIMQLSNIFYIYFLPLKE